jgi:hypothetical protein
MSGIRRSILEQDDDMDFASFAPKPALTNQPVEPATVRTGAEQIGFHSRSPSTHDAILAPKAAPKKSGRTVLLNARITQQAHDRYHAVVESERPV